MINLKSFEFSSKRVCVVGFGIEGASAVSFLLTKKARVCVFVEHEIGEEMRLVQENFETQGVEFFTGLPKDHTIYDLIVRSPGVHPLKLYDLGIVKEKITTVTNIFFALAPCPVIGVTGTKGKGTTSTLIYEILKKDGKEAYLGGNIGSSPLDFFSKLTPNSIVVLELSSFQLIDCEYSPQVAVLLMTVPEHQDWHKSVEEYVESKLQLVRFQKSDDTTVVCLDYPLNRGMLQKITGKIVCVSTLPHEHTGVYVTTRGTIVSRKKTQEKSIIATKKLGLVGKHNWENAAAAVAASLVFEVKLSTIRKVLRAFTGLPYRLELVGEHCGVKYYNDSFSTTPETTIAAIRAFESPKILILGGSSKESDFSELGKVIASSTSIRAVIGIDPEWQRIKQAIGKTPSPIWFIENCKSMTEMVQKASEVAQTGDVVLLSPGCASFGKFKNYKDRGDQYKEAVIAMQNKLNE